MISLLHRLTKLYWITPSTFKGWPESSILRWIRVIDLEYETLATVCCLYPRHSNMAGGRMAVRSALSSNRGRSF